MSPSTSPSAYTPEQITTYLRHLRVPSSIIPPSIPLSPHQLTYQFLHALHIAHLARIPYENLSIHYAAKAPNQEFGDVDLEPNSLFRKLIIGGRGRGGYCMENGIAFHHVLKALGFEVYMVGGRVRPRKDGRPFGAYFGWVHIVNIVTLPTGQRYMVDVSFGGDGSIQPLPLEPGLITRNIGTQHLRLIQDNVPGQSNLAHKFWIYQYRNEGSPSKNPDLTAHPSQSNSDADDMEDPEFAERDGWRSFYHFSDASEFLPQDFTVMNFFTSKSINWQTATILVIKFVMASEVAFYKDGAIGQRAEDSPADDDIEGRRIQGKVMMFNETVKMNLGGKTEVVQVCRTEKERVEALKKWFGIELTEAERTGIRGSKLELPGL